MTLHLAHVAPVMLMLALLASGGFARAHHPSSNDAEGLIGARLCVDDGSLTVDVEAERAEEADRLQTAITRRVASLLASAEGAYGIELSPRTRCTNRTNRLTVDVGVRRLDPTVYRGYPPDAHSLSLVIAVGASTPWFAPGRSIDAGAGEPTFVAHHVELYDGGRVDAHVTSLASEGLATVAALWWDANPPRDAPLGSRLGWLLGGSGAVFAIVTIPWLFKRRPNARNHVDRKGSDS